MPEDKRRPFAPVKEYRGGMTEEWKRTAVRECLRSMRKVHNLRWHRRSFRHQCQPRTDGPAGRDSAQAGPRRSTKPTPDSSHHIKGTQPFPQTAQRSFLPVSPDRPPHDESGESPAAAVASHDRPPKLVPTFLPHLPST